MLNWMKLKEENYKLPFRAVAKWTYRLPDGSVGDFDIIIGPQVAVVFALTEEQRVILAKQFRPGPQKVLLELPGGIVDPGETPELTIRREFLEETGYEGDIRHVGSTYQGAYSTVIIHVFVAQNCQKVKEPDLGEHIEVVTLSLDEFRRHIKTGQLSDTAAAYMVLDHLNLL